MTCACCCEILFLESNRYEWKCQCLGLQAKAEAGEVMAEALLWAEKFFRSRDQMNAEVHCVPIRLSPITERVIMALSAWAAASRK